MADWRIDNAESIRGLALRGRKYAKWSETWDHDHCAGCFAKFTEGDTLDSLHEGYVTGPEHHEREGYDWVCRTCFDDLKSEMGWSVRVEVS
ncbi:MAG TPA: hypothetical protein VII49_04550 [Rhizomicrobium sp.]